MKPFFGRRHRNVSLGNLSNPIKLAKKKKKMILVCFAQFPRNGFLYKIAPGRIYFEKLRERKKSTPWWRFYIHPYIHLARQHKQGVFFFRNTHLNLHFVLVSFLFLFLFFSNTFLLDTWSKSYRSLSQFWLIKF